MKKQLLLLVLFPLAACSSGERPTDSSITAGPSPAPDTPVLSWDGYGPLLFGMQLEQAQNIAGMRTHADRALDTACDYAAFAALPGIRFMIENGILTRAEAEPQIPNAMGITVGSSLAALISDFPQLVVTPHKYDAAGQYLLFKSPGGDRAIVMEVSNGVVTQVRAGLEPAVEYVESCL